jgi:hypothetical protein
MRLSFAFILLAAAPLMAADSDFNGRWDITANTQPRPRAWWVELTGVGTATPSGKFISSFGGDLNKIDTIALAGGQLTFTITPPPPRDPTKTPEKKRIYKARFEAGKLVGTYELEGQSDPPSQWTGVRAPVINDKDDGSWKPGRPVALFNGKDLTGWKGLNPGAEVKWSVADGILKNSPPTTDIISEQKFWNFDLHVEFRIVRNSNSGIALRGRYEIQIAENYGQQPNVHGAAALYSRVAASVNASKPPGEWQTYDIRLVGRQVTVVHNGTKVLDKVEVEGLTAMADNPDEATPGPFIVQGDHTNVEIRSFVVTPLTK